jgi:hypothetical protein
MSCFDALEAFGSPVSRVANAQRGQAVQPRQCQSERQFKCAIVSRHISIVAPYTLGAKFTVVLNLLLFL